MRGVLGVALVVGVGLALAVVLLKRRVEPGGEPLRPFEDEPAAESAPAEAPVLETAKLPEADSPRVPATDPAREPELRELHGTVVWVDRGGAEYREENGRFKLALAFHGRPAPLTIAIEAGRWRAELPLDAGLELESFVGASFELNGRRTTPGSVACTTGEAGAVEFRVHQPARVLVEVYSNLDGRALEEVRLGRASGDLWVVGDDGEARAIRVIRLRPPLVLETHTGGSLELVARGHATQVVEIDPDRAERRVVLEATGSLHVQLGRGLSEAPGITLSMHTGSGLERKFERQLELRERILFDLAPGVRTIEAVLGEGPEARLVASAEATVVAGEMREVLLVPLVGLAPVSVEGTLDLPVEWPLDDFELLLALPATLAAGGEPELRIPRKRMSVDRPGASLRRWRATLVPATYVAWLPDTGYHTTLTIVPGASAAPALSLPRPCLLRVRCAAEELIGCFRGLDTDFQFALAFPRAADGGGFELRVPEGPWRLRARSGARTREESVEVRWPLQEFAFAFP